MKVYASLTSIPSRVSRVLNANLQSLFSQDYPVDRIIITIPTVNLRGQSCANVDVSFLDCYPQVVCHRPDYDWGPVMKYVGCLEYIDDDRALVFVCDDDQQYAPDRISNLVNLWRSVKDDRAIVGWVGPGIQSWTRALRTVAAVRGVLVPKAAIVDLHAALKGTELPRCCALNDDVLASIHFVKAGYSLVDRSGQNDEFTRPENPESQDALHRMYANQRAKVRDIMLCHWRFNQPFAGVVVGSASLIGVALAVGLVWLIRALTGFD
jgi:hypothetical protein